MNFVLKYCFTEQSTLKKILTVPFKKSRTKTTNISQNIINYEASEAFHSHRQYKFGVLYAKNGQKDENAIYHNTVTSPEYEEFLSHLGMKIKIEGWKQYTGGLTPYSTEYSVYTNYKEREIMYHVATLFPEDEKDEQCIEKKRFFGNDVVVLIFQDPGTKVDVSIFSTHFTQAYIIVEPIINNNVVSEYIIATSNKTIVPPYGPYIPYPPIINKEDIRDFVITKLINAERASMRAHTFRLKMERTRLTILNDEFKTFMKKGKGSLKISKKTSKKIKKKK